MQSLVRLEHLLSPCACATWLRNASMTLMNGQLWEWKEETGVTLGVFHIETDGHTWVCVALRVFTLADTETHRYQHCADRFLVAADKWTGSIWIWAKDQMKRVWVDWSSGSTRAPFCRAQYCWLPDYVFLFLLLYSHSLCHDLAVFQLIGVVSYLWSVFCIHKLPQYIFVLWMFRLLRSSK